MSVIAAALRELMALGVEGEALIAAVERIEAAQEEVKPTAGALRQRRYRERQASRVTSQASQSVTVTPSDASSRVRDKPPSSVPSGKNHQPPSEASGARAVTPSRLKSKRCPADYEPGPRVLELAVSLGFDADETVAEIERLKDHQFREAHVDWDAAARNWLRTAAERRGRNGARAPPLSFGIQDSMVREAGYRMAMERARQLDEQDGNDQRSQGVVLALPSKAAHSR